MKVFSQFINDESLNQNQIAFINKVISHIEQNGYVESLSILNKAPFDVPAGLFKLFDYGKQVQIAQLLTSLKNNATQITA